MIVNRSHAEDAWRLLIEDGQVDRIHYPGFAAITEDDVRDLYRTAAKLVHPDAPGGSVEAFAKVDRAKHVLLKWLERQGKDGAPKLKAEQCANCEGKGHVERQSQRGFKITTLRVQCGRCRGTGEEGVEHDEGDWG